jgi:hypothetical protein
MVACLNFIQIIQVFVLEVGFQRDFVAMSLLLQNVKETKKVQWNDKHEDDHNN